MRRAALLAGGLLVACAIGVAAVLALRGGKGPVEQTTTVAKPRPRPARLERIANLAAKVPNGNTVALRARPGGRRVLARINSRTVFGSAQTLNVTARKGNWVAVRSTALGNDRIGWIDTKASPLRLLSRPLTLVADLTQRRLLVYRGNRVLRRISVAIGAADTPTPPGVFYVTDKLPGSDFGPYYGCCILALSGRQPNLPQGWSGGDRLAIHGSPSPTWGLAVSNGCLHAAEPDLRYLMKNVALGTRVVIVAGTPPAA